MSQYNGGILTKMHIRTILGASKKKIINFQGPTPYVLIFLVSGGICSFKELT